jgi:hypothetical protein
LPASLIRSSEQIILSSFFIYSIIQLGRYIQPLSHPGLKVLPAAPKGTSQEEEEKEE